MFQAAATAASAREAILDQRNMAPFAAHANHPVPDFPVQYDARAHTSTQGQHAHGITRHLLAYSALPLGQSRRIGVFLYDDR